MQSLVNFLSESLLLGKFKVDADAIQRSPLEYQRTLMVYLESEGYTPEPLDAVKALLDAVTMNSALVEVMGKDLSYHWASARAKTSPGPKEDHMQTLNQSNRVVTFTPNTVSLIKELRKNGFDVIDDHNGRRTTLTGIAVFIREDGRQFVSPCFENTQFCLGELIFKGDGIHIARGSVGGTIDNRGKTWYEGVITSIGEVVAYVGTKTIVADKSTGETLDRLLDEESILINADFVGDVMNNVNVQMRDPVLKRETPMRDEWVKHGDPHEPRIHPGNTQGLAEDSVERKAKLVEVEALPEGGEMFDGEGKRWTKVHGRMVPEGMVQVALSSIHLDVAEHESRSATKDLIQRTPLQKLMGDDFKVVNSSAQARIQKLMDDTPIYGGVPMQRTGTDYTESSAEKLSAFPDISDPLVTWESIENLPGVKGLLLAYTQEQIQKAATWMRNEAGAVSEAGFSKFLSQVLQVHCPKMTMHPFGYMSGARDIESNIFAAPIAASYMPLSEVEEQKVTGCDQDFPGETRGIEIVISSKAIQDRLVGPWDGEGWDEGMDEETRQQRIRMAGKM